MAMMSSKRSGLQATQHVAHARSFELEHAHRVAAAEQLVGPLVVERQVGEIDRDAAPRDELDRAGQHGQRLEAEEIELHQPGQLDIFEIELRHRHVGARIAVERHQLLERPVADHHARGVGRGMAVEPLELHGDVEEARDGFVLGAHMLQQGLSVDGLGEGDRIGRIVRHHLADAVDLPVRHLQHAAHVAQHGAGLQLAEGDDLRHAVAAVALLHIADDLVAPVLAEIDVEIRHRHALGIEEALEQQAPAQGIEIGDGERPGGDRARARAAARPHRNAVRLGPFDEVGDYEEIAGEAHLADHAELVMQPVAIGLGGGLALRLVHPGLEDMRRQAVLEPLLRLRAQLARLVAFAQAGERRQDRLARHRIGGAALRDDERVVDGLRNIGEKLAHLARRLEAVLGREAPALSVGDEAPLGDTEQRIMRLEHLGVGEKGLVGGDERQFMLVGELDQAGLDAVLDVEPVALQLDIEPPLENRGEPLQQRLRRRGLSLGEQPADGTRRTAGQCDEAAIERRQIVERQLRRLAVRRLEEGFADELEQRAVAFVVLGQQHELVRALRRRAAARLGLLAPQGELAADDGLHARDLGRLRELERAEEIARVGDRHRGHGLAPAALGQRLDLDRALRRANRRYGRGDGRNRRAA